MWRMATTYRTTKALARDLTALQQINESIPNSLIETTQRAGSHVDIELVIAAGI
jgi:hypothetical protein